MTTATHNYSWLMPDPGGSANTWGNTLNGTTQAIDAKLYDIVSNTATLAGLLTANNGITVNAGPVNINSNLSVGGTGYFGGALSAASSLSVTGTGYFAGAVSASSLNVTGTGYFAGAVSASSLNVTGTGYFAGAVSASSLNVTGAFGVAGAASVGSNLNVGGTIACNGFANVSGYTVSQAPSGSNAYFVLNNSAGADMGYLGWSTNNSIVLSNQTGGGFLSINPDSSISTSGTFHTQEITAADVNCSMLVCNGSGTFYGALRVNNSFITCDQTITAGGYITGTGYCSRPGSSTFVSSDLSHQYNHYWTGAQNHLYLDGSDWGQIQTTSDYRMKKNVTELGSMWERVKELKPISYTLKDWTPPASVESQKKIGGSLIRNDNIERWGFLAHELQETLVESAAHGVKDDPVCVQAPNPFTVIAALTKALQEAMTRIEALEAR